MPLSNVEFILIASYRGSTAVSLATEQKKQAHIAMNRFGLGAKPGGINRIRENVRGALQAELDDPEIATVTSRGLPSYKEACAAVHTTFDAENWNKERELSARIAKHMKPEIGFVERLVLFFSNHFSMSINKDGAVRATIGQLERDVIRKNVLGSFKAMLIGVYKHPAMLCYLDNDDSIGPNAPTGLNWGVGLNHNLARECLELHTVGVNGGYTERDIDHLACILTGWSFVRGWESDGRYNGGNARNRGQFIFRRDWHEPGGQTVLGVGYPNKGIEQGEMVLADLARHRLTAQYIAFKLVHHFITESPTPEMVDPVALAFRKSNGNLRATAMALLDLPAAWELPLTKVRTPYELQIAEMRALGRTYDPKDRWPFYTTLDALRHQPWEHLTPDGFSDESIYWMGADAMRIRLETAQMNAWSLMQLGKLGATPAKLGDQLFSAAFNDVSRRAVGQASNVRDGLATLFMLPEFQRR